LECKHKKVQQRAASLKCHPALATARLKLPSWVELFFHMLSVAAQHTQLPRRYMSSYQRGALRTSTKADTEPGATHAASSMACARRELEVKGRLGWDQQGVYTGP